MIFWADFITNFFNKDSYTVAISVFILILLSMLFSFKQKSQDFVVSEELPFTLAGKGDALYVYFEKRNMTTMEVVEHLCHTLKVSRLTL